MEMDFNDLGGWTIPIKYKQEGFDAFVAAIRHGNSEYVNFALQDQDFDVSEHNHIAFILAVHYGHVEILQILTKRLNDVVPLDIVNHSLVECAGNGHLDALKFLLSLPGADVTSDDNAAVGQAARNGRIDVLKFLAAIPGVDAGANNNYAIKRASYFGQYKVIEILITFKNVDPSVDDHYPLKIAMLEGHFEIVKILARLAPMSVLWSVAKISPCRVKGDKIRRVISDEIKLRACN